jgi:hypothetical protein
MIIVLKLIVEDLILNVISVYIPRAIKFERHYLVQINQGSEMKYTLKMMKIDKTLGLNDISSKVWRCLGHITMMWLAKLFNNIFRSNNMIDKWRRNILVQIFKNKGISKLILIMEKLLAIINRYK